MNAEMWLVWLLRGDVRQHAPLEDPEAQRAFVAWWLLYGRAEYPAVWRWDAAQAAVAMEPVEIGPGLACPRMLRHLYKAREDLQQSFPLNDAESLAEYLCWYRLYGPVELAAAPLLPEEYLAMTDSPSGRQPWCSGPQVPRMAIALSNALSRPLPNGGPAGRQALAAWYAGGGWAHLPRSEAASKPVAVEMSRKLQSGGVNLIGFVRGQSGLGEDVRAAAAALDAAAIPYAVIDVPAGASMPQRDLSLDHRIESQPVYDVSLYCMSPFDMAALYVGRDTGFFAGQYRIGYWPWELPRFPDEWHAVYDLVDEIWTGSAFTAEAYRASCPNPVQCLPCPVQLPAVQRASRSGLGLHAARAFVFSYPFDPNSTFARKNPLALVRAFRRAFPPEDRDAALLLRVNGSPADQPAWRDLCQAVSSDDRITLLEGTFDRAGALGILAACDCLVSPHRAEGFGRNIAEAILLGLPVLATGFSGCLDFIAPGERIDWTPRTVRPGEYPYAAGLRWAEPSEIDMAAKMQHVREAMRGDARRERARLAARAAQFALEYGPTKRGRAFAERLKGIAAKSR